MQSFWSSLLGSEIKTVIPSHLRRRAPAYVLAAATLLPLLAAQSTAFAGSATWNLNLASGDWNTATNGTPSAVDARGKDCGRFTLTQGTVFTVIDNTAATPIAGTFSNLADDSTFTDTANTFQASYEDGDGNDLTLTVQWF